MAYTPELSYTASCTLRRIAWAVNKPMTTTLELIFTELLTLINGEWVCGRCRDPTRCHTCGFNQNHEKGDHPCT